MNGELLYGINGAIFSLVLFVILTVTIRLGCHFGLRKQAGINDAGRSQFASIQGAVLGLLALLLGFTFAMTVSRFDARKQLVLEEANAIGTAFLRAQLLPEPNRSEIAGLLRRYVDVRLLFYEAGIDEKKLRETNDQSERIQRQLWSQATAVAKLDKRAVTTGLFIQTLNEVIDLHAKRITAMQNHVPESIILLLCLVAILSLGLTGYGCGLAGQRHVIVTTTMAILIVAVIYLIIDLDRPRRGLIKVSQKSMIDLRESINKATR